MTDKQQANRAQDPGPLDNYFNRLTSWLSDSSRVTLITSYAVLAFVITILIQLRLQGPLDRRTLAMIATGTLLLSVLLGYFVQAVIKTKAFWKEVLKAYWELAIGIEEIIEGVKENEKFIRRKHLIKTKICEAEEIPHKGSPTFSILIQWITLAAGIILSATYFWLYLFC